MSLPLRGSTKFTSQRLPWALVVGLSAGLLGAAAAAPPARADISAS